MGELVVGDGIVDDDSGQPSVEGLAAAVELGGEGGAVREAAEEHRVARRRRLVDDGQRLVKALVGEVAPLPTIHASALPVGRIVATPCSSISVESPSPPLPWSSTTQR